MWTFWGWTLRFDDLTPLSPGPGAARQGLRALEQPHTPVRAVSDGSPRHAVSEAALTKIAMAAAAGKIELVVRTIMRLRNLAFLASILRRQRRHPRPTTRSEIYATRPDTRQSQPEEIAAGLAEEPKLLDREKAIRPPLPLLEIKLGSWSLRASIPSASHSSSRPRSGRSTGGRAKAARGLEVE